MKDSAIEWTDHTFNPWEGCTKVSPGCANCYAEARNQRFSGGKNWGKGAPRRRTKTWGEPLKWQRAQEDGEGYPRPRVFCASLADWLDDEVPIEWLADLLKLIHDTPNLDWLLLTKRPGNFLSRVNRVCELWACDGGYRETHESIVYHDMLVPWRCGGRPPENVWIGTTVEDQARADERIPQLLQIPARVRFLSCEPLLEEIVISRIWRGSRSTHREIHEPREIHWVICGGESGRGKRPFNPDWARSLRDQCAADGVPFFMKQMDKVQPIPTDLMTRQFPNLDTASA